MSNPLVINIETETIQNTYYREVIYTGKFQLVLMSLMPGEDIPFETHPDIDQFVRVESGQGIVNLIDHNNDSIIITYQLADGDSVVVPAGIEHHFKNTDQSKPLKLYSIYSSPEHPSDRLDQSQPI